MRSVVVVPRRLLLGPEVWTFLAVGGTGYVVDVTAFNALRSTAALGSVDPSVARVLAVAVAMVVTYLGNRWITWRGAGGSRRRREVGLFVLFNLVGMAISVATLTVSHDLLGLTSRLDDNVSANGVGLALGTLFRYWSYRSFVFGGPDRIRGVRAPTGSRRATRAGRPVRVAMVAGMVVLSGCGAPGPGPAHGTSHSGGADTVTGIPADGETRPTRHPGDSADDPAIWVDGQDPARSLIIGNDKQGALETYDLDGRLVQRVTAPTDFWGNVDVRQQVILGDTRADIVAVANAGVRLYRLDPSTRGLVPITAGGGSLDTSGGEGVCLYDSPEGELSVFMVNITGVVRQFALRDDGTGTLSAQQVRSFEVGSEAEGCVVDDQARTLYIDEENVGTWAYDADPDGGARRTMLDRVRPQGHQIADIEGITLVDDGSGNGLLIASSQGQSDERSYFSVFDRASGRYLSSFRIVDGPEADGCSHTDGVAATSEPLGPRFPHGLFVCQDDHNTAPGTSGNQDFKLTRLEKVRPAMGLG